METACLVSKYEIYFASETITLLNTLRMINYSLISMSIGFRAVMGGVDTSAVITYSIFQIERSYLLDLNMVAEQ